MKKKLLLLFSALVLILSCIPSTKAFAEGYAQDLNTGESVTSLVPHTITVGDEKDLSVIQAYRISIPGTEKTLVLPINIDQKGVLLYDVLLPDENTTVKVDIELYTDQACTQKLDFYPEEYYANITEAGVYYVKFIVTDTSETIPENYVLGFAANLTIGVDRTLTNNVWTTAGNPDTSKAIYYKITTTKTGSLTINTESSYSGSITLLNSSKKAISDKVNFYGKEDKVCFAVTKGTYYLKVESTSDIYRIKYAFKAINDTSGSTKAKAKKLTAGKAVTGVVTASDKSGKVDWYKITLTKKTKVDVAFTGSVSSGSISLKFYGNGIIGSIDETINLVDQDASFSPVVRGTTTLPKGTYYIKVTKNTKNTSGFYTLKFTK